MANRKEVKIAFVVDQDSFNNVIRRINELAAATKKAMGGVSGLTGGILGGSTKTTVHRGVSGGGKAGQGGNTTSVGISQGAIRAIQEQKAMMDSLGTSASKVLRDLEKDVQQSVRNQSGHLQELARSAKMVTDAYRQMGGAGRGMSGPGFGGSMGGGYGGGPGGGISGPGFGGPTGGGYGGPSGPTGGPGGGFNMAPGGNIIPSVNTVNTNTMPWGRMAAGVMAGGTYLAANAANVVQDLPYFEGQQRAQWGAAAGGMGVQMRRITGQGVAANYAHAFDQQRYRGQMQDILSEIQEAQKSNLPDALNPNLLIAKGKLAATERGGDAEMAARGMASSLKMLPSGLNDLSKLFDAPQVVQALRKKDQESRLRQLNAINDEMASDPLLYGRINDFVESTDSRVAFQRGSGTGGQYTDRDGNVRNRALDRLAKLKMRGYSGGDLVGGISSVAQYGSRALAEGGAGDLAMAATQAGHIPAAAQILGMAAQMGSNPTQALKQLAGTGFDKQVVSNMGAMIANVGLTSGTSVDFGAMTSHYQGSMNAAMAGQEFVNKGMEGAAQAANMRALQKGGQSMDSLTFGGGRDALQKGLNYVNALDSFGGNVDAAQFIADNPNALNMAISALHTKEIPPLLKAMGITSLDQLQKFVDSSFTDRARLIGANDFGQDSEMRDLQRDMLSGGYGMNYGKYAKDKGLKGKDLKNFITKATAMEMANFNIKDEETARGEVLREIGVYSPGVLKEGKLGDARGKVEAEIQRQQGTEDLDAAGTVGTIKAGDIQRTRDKGRDLTGLAKMQETAGAFSDSLDALGKSIRAYADAVNGAAGSIRTSKAPKVKK